MTPDRPLADRLVRVFALLTIVTMTALLILGGLVTTLGAGMADPGWPRSATYIAEDPKVWQEGQTGLLVEHAHRALGFLTGAFASLLALASWSGEPRRGLRWAGRVCIIILLVLYGEFYREMSDVRKAREAAVAEAQDPGPLMWPMKTGIECAVAAAVLVSLGVGAVQVGSRNGWLRLLVSVGLVAVMIQGLLGGFRVFLNQLIGPELAAIHGAFAQVVFCLMMCVVVLSAAPDFARILSDDERTRLGTLSLVVPASVFVQLIWGVMLRHMGSPLSQRLHILTAFVVSGLTVWLAARIVATPAGRARLGFYAWHLLAIVAVQVLLGVEAYMGKFAAAGPHATKLPFERPVSVGAAAIRTTHVLIGTALLAATVVLAVRVFRRLPQPDVQHPQRDETSP